MGNWLDKNKMAALFVPKASDQLLICEMQGYILNLNLACIVKSVLQICAKLEFVSSLIELLLPARFQKHVVA